jgi:hypothetical protein
MMVYGRLRMADRLPLLRPQPELRFSALRHAGNLLAGIQVGRWTGS